MASGGKHADRRIRLYNRVRTSNDTLETPVQVWSYVTIDRRNQGTGRLRNKYDIAVQREERAAGSACDRFEGGNVRSTGATNLA